MELTLGTWRISVERTPPTPDELVAAYEGSAGVWHDRLATLGYKRAYDVLFTRLRAEGVLQDLKSGGRVLDGGVGTGAFGLALAETLVGNAAPPRIDGVDISAAMLDQARSNLESKGVATRLHLGDVRDLPFGDETFDAAISAHVLEHLDDPLAGLSEMIRVLKPGGPLILVATRRGFPDALLRLRWRYRFIDGDQLLRSMGIAGLSGARSYSLEGGGLLPHRTSCAYAGFKRSTN